MFAMAINTVTSSEEIEAVAWVICCPKHILRQTYTKVIKANINYISCDHCNVSHVCKSCRELFNFKRSCISLLEMAAISYLRHARCQQRLHGVLDVGTSEHEVSRFGKCHEQTFSYYMNSIDSITWSYS